MKEQYSDCKLDQMICGTSNMHIKNDFDKSTFGGKDKTDAKAYDIDDDQGVDMHEHDEIDGKSGFYLCYSTDPSEHSNVEYPKTNTIECASPVVTEDTKTSKLKETKKRKFRNLIPVLRRSQSVGSEAQLVPDHALFLQYDPGAERSLAQASSDNDARRTIHKTCSADSAMMAAESLPVDPQDVLKHKHKSSLAKNMRRKFQKLKRGNTDSLLGSAFTTIRGGVHKITQADAIQWGTSFEALLRDKNGLEMFKNFLKSEFSEENIEFWISCEEFKSVRTNKLVAEAKRIYSQFIAIKAPKQVNIDSKTRLDTVTNLENPTRDMFKEAQKRVQFLMENDSYKRFLDSEQYRQLLRRHSGAEDR
ncbi:Regulator of G-protein signaling 3 [Mactra antiquata]